MESRAMIQHRPWARPSALLLALAGCLAHASAVGSSVDAAQAELLRNAQMWASKGRMDLARQNIDKLPALGDVPVLGALFRSRDYTSGQTELVIIIEAYVVSPTAPGRMQTPADGLQIANDAQTILFGQLSQRYGSPDPAAAAGGSAWQGPVGYVIE